MENMERAGNFLSRADSESGVGTQQVDNRVVSLTAPASNVAEQYRSLYYRLERMRALRPMKVIAFASAVANAAAVALRNARSVQEIRSQVERAEAKASQLARFEEVFDYVLDGIAVTANTNGRLIAMNPAGLSILGYSATEALGKKMRELVMPLDEDLFRTITRSVLQGVPVQGTEIAFETPSPGLKLSVPETAV